MAQADERQQFLKFALQLATTAEQEILPLFKKTAVGLKADGSEVTDADRNAEKLIRSMIEESYPHHGILGEEFGAKEDRIAEEYCWIIDPLDGTSSFSLGVPLFGTLIALAENNDPILGVIHFPILRETVYAVKGSGCWRRSNGGVPERLHVRNGVPLNEATVSISGVHRTNVQLARSSTSYNLSRLVSQAAKMKFFGDCFQHALVCEGHIHAAIDTIMKPWDIAALIPCVEEAGGVATSLSGDRKGILSSESLLSSCHPSLHNEILAVFHP